MELFLMVNPPSKSASLEDIKHVVYLRTSEKLISASLAAGYVTHQDLNLW